MPSSVSYLASRLHIQLTGITPQVLAANHALPFRDVWAQFALWLSEVAAEAEAEGADEAGSEGGEGVEGGDGGSGSGGVVFVAHNAKFDHKFLMEEQERGGFDKFMMGQQMGVVALVDSLAVLREQSIWRQNGTDWDVPRRPDKFKLSGAHTALGDVTGLERVLSAPGIRERWVAARGERSPHLPDFGAAILGGDAGRSAGKRPTRE
eukprot:jgi/Undpi1/9496/HiC_scaffold_27.g11952.m1